jgi:hypothetical protein
LTAILTNHEAELLLLDIRIGRAAGTAEVQDLEGSFLAFPTSVVVAVPGRGHNVFPIRTTAEPGTVCHTRGRSSLSGEVAGVSVEGHFSWGMDAKVSTAAYRFRRSGCQVARPEWAGQLPQSQRLQPVGPAVLARQRARLVRKGDSAECELLRRTARVFEHVCQGPLRRAIAVRPSLGVSDVVQRGMQVAGRLLPLYSSAARPPCSWIGMIQLDGRRDLHRAVTQLDWLPRDLAEVLGRLETAGGVAPGDDPSEVLAAMIEAAVSHHQPVPRATLRQIEAALSAPRLIPLDTTGTDVATAAACQHGLSEGDPALEWGDDQPGRLTAAVGRLIGADPSVVARASLGDHAAIAKIGHGVIAALRQPGESSARAQQRCRREFDSAGRLFASGDGLACFGHRTPAPDLVQLDADLVELAQRPAT